MKNKSSVILLLLFIVLIQGCNNDDVGNGVKKVKSFDKISVDGDVTVRVKKSSSSEAEVELKVVSSPEFYSKITASSENGLLTLNATGEITFDKNIVVELAVPDLTSIRLENTQHASIIFVGDFPIPSIDIVTEAESKLELYNLQADVITSRQEGESDLIISSEMDPLVGPLTFTGDIIEINNTTILVENKILVTGNSIEVNTTVTPHVYTVIGAAIKKYYLAETASFITQGTSGIQADNLFVKELDIKLEGESKANVWVKDLLTGKGEGSSILTYAGEPSIQYSTSGTAKVIKK